MNEFREMWFKLKERIISFADYYSILQNKPKYEICKVFLEMMEDIEEEHGITIVTVTEKNSKRNKTIKEKLLKITKALLSLRNKHKENNTNEKENTKTV